MNASVLVLNATYEPINICVAQRAIVLILKGLATSEEETPHYFHSPSFKIRIPSVIRLLHYIKIPRMRDKPPTKKNILIRDKYTCQYCGKKYKAMELTLDHVIPKSRGGHTRWENLVTCCKTCNTRKGDLSLSRAGMTLLKSPREPRYHFQIHFFQSIGTSRTGWRKYLFCC
jgi:5-methylcytosine-specific restriction endonuclease McrA